jgi:hypothetical protein
MSNTTPITAIEAGISASIDVQIELEKLLLELRDRHGPQVLKRFLWAPWDMELSENDAVYKRNFKEALDLFKLGRLEECRSVINYTLTRKSAVTQFWRIQNHLLCIATARCWDVAHHDLNEAQDLFQAAQKDDKLNEEEVSGMHSALLSASPTRVVCYNA